MSDPQAVHIFPFATSKSKRFQPLDDLLQCFWGKEQASTWRRLFEDPAITQSLANRVSINRQFHVWFGKTRFAFKPLSQTPTTITLQFHWLRRTNLLPSTLVEASGEAILNGLRMSPETWGLGNLAHRASGMPLKTGQTFVIRAENAEDLPSFELLELQWNLHRIAAICGAADLADLLDSDRGY